MKQATLNESITSADSDRASIMSQVYQSAKRVISSMTLPIVGLVLFLGFWSVVKECRKLLKSIGSENKDTIFDKIILDALKYV